MDINVYDLDCTDNAAVAVRQPNQLSVSAVVPAFNESSGISAVLKVLKQIDCLDEIIVVDDGSEDSTSEIVHQVRREDPRVRIIQHESNQGKGQSIYSAWRTSGSDCLLLIDADLINLTPCHVWDLIAPVRTHRAQMSYGLFYGGQWDTDFSHFIAPWLTGQRCIRSELLHEVPEEATYGYGFETALTITARKKKWTSVKIPMKGVTHLVKENHRGFWKGLRNRAAMWSDIIHAWRILSRYTYSMSVR
jgi:glycosyltransferase involved in cell wall biosynthesis